MSDKVGKRDASWVLALCRLFSCGRRRRFVDLCADFWGPGVNVASREQFIEISDSLDGVDRLQSHLSLGRATRSTDPGNAETDFVLLVLKRQFVPDLESPLNVGDAGATSANVQSAYRIAKRISASIG